MGISSKHAEEIAENESVIRGYEKHIKDTEKMCEKFGEDSPATIFLQRHLGSMRNGVAELKIIVQLMKTTAKKIEFDKDL
jgi:hypothetical protein